MIASLLRKFIVLRFFNILAGARREGLSVRQAAADVKRWLIRAAIVLLLLAAVFITVLILVMASIIRDGRFGVPVPAGWRQTDEAGSVSSLCLGGHEPCGVLTRHYDTKAGKDSSFAAVRHSLEQAGWNVEAVEHSRERITARAAPKEADSGERAAIEVRENKAVIEYRK